MIGAGGLTKRPLNKMSDLDFLKERAVPGAFSANFGPPTKSRGRANPSECVCRGGIFRTPDNKKDLFDTLIWQMESISKNPESNAERRFLS